MDGHMDGVWTNVRQAGLNSLGNGPTHSYDYHDMFTRMYAA
jgi:hypothetical protein